MGKQLRHPEIRPPLGPRRIDEDAHVIGEHPADEAESQHARELGRNIARGGIAFEAGAADLRSRRRNRPAQPPQPVIVKPQTLVQAHGHGFGHRVEPLGHMLVIAVREPHPGTQGRHQADDQQADRQKQDAGRPGHRRSHSFHNA